MSFGDTDAAGLTHFHQLVPWGVWREPGALRPTTAASVFPRPEWAGDPPAMALPIVSCQAEVRRPLLVGDQLLISLRPEVLGTEGLEVSDSFDREGQPVAQGLTRHLAIDAAERHRCPLPEGIRRWLEASGLTNWVRPISCGVPPLSTAAVNQDGRHASWPRWIKQLFRSLSGDPSQFTPEEKP